MMLSNDTDVQSENNENEKPSPPKEFVISKYRKKLAEKKFQTNRENSSSTEPANIEEEVKKQDEKSDDNRDKINPFFLKDVEKTQASNSLESGKRVQLTKKSIMQEKLFKSLCESMQHQILKESPIESTTNKPIQNNSKEQNNKLRKKNYNRSRKKKKSKKSAVPGSFSKNSLESSAFTNSMEQQIPRKPQNTESGNKFFQNYSNQQNNGSKINTNTSNKLVYPSSSSNNSLKLSSSTSATNNILLSQNEITTSEKNNIECKSVLHLKQPLMNEQNEAIYYENHGRMEPISWSLLNVEEDSSSKRNTVETQKLRRKQESIKKIAITKDEADNEFLNFVVNTTDSKTVFCAHNNLTQIKKIDSSLPKIEISINKKNIENLQVTAQIKKKFRLSQLKSTRKHVIDLIDYSMKQSSSIDKTMNQKISEDIENCSALVTSELQEKFVEKSEDFYFKKESEHILSTPLKEKVDFNNTVKKKKGVEYDDDMFNFEKPTCKGIPPIKENGNSMMSGTVKELNIEPQEYFIKLKQLHEKQLDSSMDSDDFSLDCTSEIDDLSALRGSTYSKFEAVTSKIRNSLIEDSYKYNQNENVEQKDNKGSNKRENKKRIAIMEKNLDIMPTEIKEKLVEKIKGKSNIEFELDSGLGLKTSNSTKTDSFVTTAAEDYSEESCIIYHKHSIVPSTVDIQEIDVTPKTETIFEGNITEAETVRIITQFRDHVSPAYMADYENINPEEEFDIVNVEEFGPCVDLINELNGVTVAQKAIATGMMKEDNVKATMRLEENNNEMSTEIVKCRSSESANLITEKDEPTVAEYPLNDCDKTLKICNPTTTRSGVSKRMQKMKNALQKYQKKLKTKDTGEGNTAEKIQQEQQRPIDALKDQSLRTRLIIPRHRILKEILKQNLHLQCKPMLVQGMK